MLDHIRKLDGSLFRVLFQDSILAGLAMGLSRVFIFILNIVVSRGLNSQSEYGIFSTIYLTIQLIWSFCSLGLAQTSAKVIGSEGSNYENQGKYLRSILSLLLMICVTSSLLMLFFAPVIGHLLENKVPVSLIRFGAILLFGQLFMGVMEGVMRGLKLFKWLPIAALSAMAAGSIFMYPLVERQGVSGGLTALLIFLLVNNIVMLFGIGDRITGKVLPLKEVCSILCIVAAPTFLSAVMSNVAMMVPPLMLVRSEFGLKHMAIWNASAQLSFFITFGAIVIVNTSIPHLSQLFKEGVLGKRQVFTSLAMSICGGVIPYIPLVIFSKKIISIYGNEYSADSFLLVLVSSFTLVQVLGTCLFGVILAIGKIWQAAALTTVYCAVVLLLSPWAINIKGAYSLSLLYLFSFVPVVIGMMAIMWGSINKKTNCALEYK